MGFYHIPGPIPRDLYSSPASLTSGSGARRIEECGVTRRGAAGKVHHPMSETDLSKELIGKRLEEKAFHGL